MNWSSAQLAKRLYREDKEAHLADIAVLKGDAMGTRGSLSTRERLRALERLDAAEHDLDALIALPEHTLGHAYARFMRDHGLSPFVLTDAVEAEVVRRNAFIVRYAATHDLFHVLLDFDTSGAGEIGVLGFAVAQRYAGFQRWAAVLAFLLYPFMFGASPVALVRAYRRGLRLGRRADFLLDKPLEAWFDRPLDELRAELGLAAAARRVETAA